MGPGRIGLSLSVSDSAHLGSSLSIRAFSRMGSAVSAAGVVRIGGQQLSVCGALQIGASLSLRSFARLASAVAVLGFGHLGASLSLRSFSRLGLAVSTLDFAHLGSTLSMRGFARCGSSISVSSKVHFTYTNTYITSEVSSTNQLQFYVNNQRSLSLMQKPTGPTTGNVGGALHGLWYSDHMLHISDRRLKKSIHPLATGLDERASAAGVVASDGQGAAWILRQLRPVSYYFTRDAEAKHPRFGFIADEVAETLPEVIQESSDERKIKGIAYQDLIAVMVAGVQSLTSRLEQTEGVSRTLSARLAALESSFLQWKDSLSRQCSDLEARLLSVESWRRVVRESPH